MSNLIDIEGYETKGIKIDPNGTEGEVLELHGLLVVLPKKPPRSQILFHDSPKSMQLWKRIPMPEELQRIRSMDEWLEKPAEFRKKFRAYIEQEFQRRRDGVWFYNNGEPTYITGRHYMFLQWSKLISDTHHTSLSKGKSFSTWLLAKLIPVVSVSYILVSSFWLH